MKKGWLAIVLAIGIVGGGFYLQQQVYSQQDRYYEIYDCRVPVIPANLTTKTRYYLEAELMAYKLQASIDAVQPFAWHLWKTNEIRDVEDIIEILSEEKGVCRHKTAIAFWLIKYLKPESEVRAVGGYEYGTPGITYRWSKEFDSNHVWVEIDGEIIDFTVNGSYYTPYYQITLRKPSIPVVGCFFEKKDFWELSYSLNYTNILEQYESDMGNHSFKNPPRLPWQDKKNIQIV